MIRILAALSEAGFATKMLLQVHDELIFEVQSLNKRRNRSDYELMETAAEPVLKLAVPIVAEAGIADSWADAH